MCTVTVVVVVVIKVEVNLQIAEKNQMIINTNIMYGFHLKNKNYLIYLVLRQMQEK